MFFLYMEDRIMKLFEKIIEAVAAGDAEQCTSLAGQAIDQGIDPFEVIQQGFSRGMEFVGDKFEKMEIFLPELMMCGDAMKAAMDVLKPHLRKGIDSSTRGTVVLGTIQGDLHDLGKNIVRTMLEASSFTVHDLGCDVPVRQFIEKAEEVQADIIAASAILTTTMAYMPDIAGLLGETNARERFKIIVGGGPVTPDYAKEAGADGYGENAAEAVKVARRLMQENDGGVEQ